MSVKASNNKRQQIIKVIATLALLLASWQILSSLYLPAKAQLAQWLIAKAWEQTKKDGNHHAPWSWADTYPIAHINFPSINQSNYILAGGNNRNMAFGPVKLDASGMFGEPLSTVISGHNDSHFAFLNQLKLNDFIQIETQTELINYRIESIEIIDSTQKQITLTPQPQLILTTCYPFNSLQTGSKLRYQITATQKNRTPRSETPRRLR